MSITVSPITLNFAAEIGDIDLSKPLTDADISNLAADGKIWGANSRQRMYTAGNKLWHTDSSSTRIAGVRTNSSCGTTVAPCTAAPITTICAGCAICGA